MLKKILLFVVFLQALLGSGIPGEKFVAKVPKFLESLMNSSQVSDDCSDVTFEDELDVESQHSPKLEQEAMEIGAYDYYYHYGHHVFATTNPYYHTYNGQAYTSNNHVQTIPSHHASHLAHLDCQSYDNNHVQTNPSRQTNNQLNHNGQNTPFQTLFSYNAYHHTHHNVQACKGNHIHAHPSYHHAHETCQTSATTNRSNHACSHIRHDGQDCEDTHHSHHQDYQLALHNDRAGNPHLSRRLPYEQRERTPPKDNKDFNPLIISNARYIVAVLDRDNIGKRKNADPEKKEYEKARKMLNDMFLELKSLQKVRDVLRKIRNPIGSKLETQVRTTIGSQDFLSEDEKDRINELFLQVGYNRIIPLLKNDKSWARPILPRTVDAVLSSRKYLSEAEMGIIVKLFRDGSNDLIIRPRREVLDLLQRNSSWTRPVRDDVLHKIELDLTTGAVL